MLTEKTFTSYAQHCIDHAASMVERNGGLRPVIGSWRGTTPDIWVFPGPFLPGRHRHARDPMLQAAGIVIEALEPQAITILHDTYLATSPVKTDGTPWESGGMERAVQEGGPDAALVMDCFSVWMHARDGSSASATQPYTVKVGALGQRKVSLVKGPDARWMPAGAPGHASGVIPETIAEQFARPTLRQVMSSDLEHQRELGEDFEFMARVLAPDAPGPDLAAQEELHAWAKEHPQDAYAHIVCAVVKTVLLPLGCAIAVGIHSPAVASIYRDSLSEIAHVRFAPDR